MEYFLKQCYFFIDSYIWRKNFNSYQNYFDQVLKTAFYGTKKNNLVRNKFISNIIFLFSFGHWGKVFGFVSASFGWGSQNSNQSVQGNVLKKNCFFFSKLQFPHLFRILTESFRRFFPTFLRGLLCSAFYVSKSAFWGFFFREFKIFHQFHPLPKKVGPSSKMLSTGLPNSSSMCQVE